MTKKELLGVISLYEEAGVEVKVDEKTTNKELEKVVAGLESEHGTAHRVTKEDIEANGDNMPDDIKVGDVVLLPIQEVDDETKAKAEAELKEQENNQTVQDDVQDSSDSSENKPESEETVEDDETDEEEEENAGEPEMERVIRHENLRVINHENAIINGKYYIRVTREDQSTALISEEEFDALSE